MKDPRDREYAELLVGTCLDVQPGWQVVVRYSPAAEPLFDEVARALARRGAYVLPRTFYDLGTVPTGWIREASDELLTKPAPLEEQALLTCDAIVGIIAPENTRAGSDVDPATLRLLQQATVPVMNRMIGHQVPWVGCQYPTPALAQEAGMTTEQFADFLYGAVLLDWDAERERMTGIKELFDAAEEVRVVGEETDIRVSLAGRHGKIDAGGANMPGGEVFYSPVEDSAEGVLHFTEFPGFYAGRELSNIRLRFEGGRVVEAAADSNEDFLLEVLDSDDGARRLGELGIGCNPGIDRYMKNVLFDEKIDGTVHFALGRGFPELGGTNESSIHWDIVKDVRRGGRIELDGRIVQAAGEWLT